MMDNDFMSFLIGILVISCGIIIYYICDLFLLKIKEKRHQKVITLLDYLNTYGVLIGNFYEGSQKHLWVYNKTHLYKITITNNHKIRIMKCIIKYSSISFAMKAINSREAINNLYTINLNTLKSDLCL